MPNLLTYWFWVLSQKIMSFGNNCKTKEHSRIVNSQKYIINYSQSHFLKAHINANKVVIVKV